ncbi:unnamed protein product [Durusdinium trenchii]|uniref:Uncharacterized protein n=2 Tax=Durusdinium trenchii TaxID=1381693 RepID=A0ABP0LX00_9DINO
MNIRSPARVRWRLTAEQGPSRRVFLALILLVVGHCVATFLGPGSGARNPRVLCSAVEAKPRVGSDAKESTRTFRDATVQSFVDGQFIEQVLQASNTPEVLSLLRAHRADLRLAETTMVLERLLELSTDSELQVLLEEEILKELLESQVHALNESPLRVELTVALASLGDTLIGRGLPQGQALLEAGLGGLRLREMKLSELKMVLSSLAGVEELRREALDTMAELVHRMGPDIMVLVLEVLATYQDLPPDHDLINDIISRAIQKDFRFTPQQRPGILVEEEHGGNKICSDCLDVSL